VNAMKILECIPNISEGKDRDKIDAVAAVISGAEGVKLLDVAGTPTITGRSSPSSARLRRSKRQPWRRSAGRSS